MLRNVTTLLAALLIAIAAHAQSARPQFEVASIKPSQPNPLEPHGVFCHGSDLTVPPTFTSPLPAQGHCAIRSLSLRSIISAAYSAAGVTMSDDERITGGPGWVSAIPFDIEAKAEDVASVTQAQLWAMMRELLADRFKLQFHTVPKDVKGYSLLVGKGGAKLKPGDGQGGSRYVGGKMITTNTSMFMLAHDLSVRLQAPVIDQTGLSGGYAFTLSLPSDSDAPAPSLFTVLDEELGLRLESAKVPVDVIVIDHAEKPSEN